MRRLILILAALCAAPAPAQAATRPVDVRATVRTVDSAGTQLVQQGEFSGAPFGRGTAKLAVRVADGGGATFTFKLYNRHGQVHGSGTVALSVRGTSMVYRGTARITRGSGAFARYRANALKLEGSGRISGDEFKVRLTGRVTT